MDNRQTKSDLNSLLEPLIWVWWAR